MNPQSSTTNGNLNRQVKEKCIFCKKDTEYNTCKPIHMRYFYVEGCGQLCGKCYYNHAYSLGMRKDGIIDTMASINNLQIDPQ